MLTRFDNKNLAAGFRRWLSFVSSHKHDGEIRALKDQIRSQEIEKQKILCHRVFQRIVNRNLVLAWESWQEHVRTWRLLDRISARFRNQGMSRTFNQWQYFSNNQKYKREKVVQHKKLEKNSNRRIRKSGERMTFFRRRLTKSKIFAGWRAFASKENSYRVIQSTNVLRNALQNCHTELRIMKDNYHKHLQFEVEGLLRYMKESEEGEKGKSLEYKNAESVLHTHKVNMSRKTPERAVMTTPSPTGKGSIHMQLVDANKGRPVPFLNGTSAQKTSNNIGRIQSQLAKSFNSNRHAMESEAKRGQSIDKKKTKPPVFSVKQLKTKKKTAKSIRGMKSKHVKPQNSIVATPRKDLQRETIMKKHSRTSKKPAKVNRAPIANVLRKKKRKKIAASTKRVTLTAEQSSKQNTAMFNFSDTFDRKRHLITKLQDLRLAAESAHSPSHTVSNTIHSLNTPPSRSRVKYKHKSISPKVIVEIPQTHSDRKKGEVYQSKNDAAEAPGSPLEGAIVHLIDLLQDYEDPEKAQFSDEEETKPRHSPLELQRIMAHNELEEQRILEEQRREAERAIQAKHDFDNLLVDYARRVHDYRDPTLVEASRPMPMLPLHREREEL